MLMIRLARAGTNNKPFYHVVACNKRGPRDGKYLERLGYYQPKEKDATKKLKIDLLALDGWVKKGAKISDTVHQLINKTPKV